MEIIFWFGTISLGPVQYVNQCFDWHKNFGLAQNILRPVERQGIGWTAWVAEHGGAGGGGPCDTKDSKN